MTEKTVLITGASSGIGLALARRFAAEGWCLVLVARREDKLNALAAELRERHSVQAHVVAVDLSQADAGERVERAVQEAGVRVDALVNNAGFGSNGPFHEQERARELAMLQVNMVALTDLTHRFLGPMVSRGHGHVLNVASTAGFQPGPLMAVYYATKAYVISFTEALSHELAGTGVTATAHCPGATATEFAQEAGNDKTLLFKLSVASAESVADHAYRAMLRGKPVAIPGVVNWLGAFGGRFSPRWLVATLAGRLNKS